ncbi:hypothetical protein ERJ75_001792500 [Trypanosoma vivax]|nr:hypothetical protein ERJ75_001792500 [Trypanosoma vivax]
MSVRTALRARPGAKHGARRSPQGTAPRPARERVRVSGRRDTGGQQGRRRRHAGRGTTAATRDALADRGRGFDENRASADARLRSHLGHRHGGRGARPRGASAVGGRQCASKGAC